ncbi:uncharacterized protein PHACADRAFT_260246 [Phanerochaete carnosa HHB-10118-sp]|uniref:Heterokaryon incompatibility domain-containing protein n=1 Tax=Phanerochaete carnosa (strain HHB-10118-sp) TaxID=650164 RepID=K5UUR2_PHACS|nr:uncharacterized protein PHACADRAFT_260246 [Phanerochaete carnosa HHB-10118-sp]EKM53751.1 hypothetical protein PHACADRAFT_260246 [Phanerochaete carnosa HHB-10118-sp]
MGVHLTDNSRRQPYSAMKARREVWGRIKMSELGVPLDRLFTSNGQGKAFSLVPEPRSSIPFQWVHFGPGAIPNILANTPCTALNIPEALDLLNDILGTSHLLTKPGLERCLDHFLRNSQDFGQVYGSLRCHWRSNFTRLLSDLAEKRTEDEATRRNALDGDHISNSQVPPRRVWDLYSNRVFPYYAIDLDEASHTLWTISHSWVRESARTDVWTPINGYEWPVSIPKHKDASLNHVRVELLNLGAEYVWLDVLCLRQRGCPENEELRKEEWKLDVPTIGYVYSFQYRPCVTYFNGLGLPFDPSPRALASTRHWCKRVWTVQEATDNWLPGGATGATSEDTRRFFREHLPRSIPRKGLLFLDHMAFAVQAMRGRHSTTELDRVHGLAYILDCETLPIYDEGISPTLAWIALLKHMSPFSRWRVALRHAKRYPDDTSLLPSWRDFMRCGRKDTVHPSDYLWSYSDLRLLDPSRVHMLETGAYFHKAIYLFGPVVINREGKEDESGYEKLKLQAAGASGDLSCYEIRKCKIRGTFSRDVKHVILKLASDVWVVAEVNGEQQVEGKLELEVIKRGCIFFPSDKTPRLQWSTRCVVYISEGEDRRRKVVFRRPVTLFGQRSGNTSASDNAPRRALRAHSRIRTFSRDRLHQAPNVTATGAP